MVSGLVGCGPGGRQLGGPAMSCRHSGNGRILAALHRHQPVLLRGRSPGAQSTNAPKQECVERPDMEGERWCECQEGSDLIQVRHWIVLKNRWIAGALSPSARGAVDAVVGGVALGPAGPVHPHPGGGVPRAGGMAGAQPLCQGHVTE